MNDPRNDGQRLHTVAINVRLADEPLSVMSLRLLNAAANLQPLPNERSCWTDAPPVVQLGSLETRGGYLRQVEGAQVGEIPGLDAGGAVLRVAPRADVLGIDAPIEPGKEREVGLKIRSIIEAGRVIGARVLPYLACTARQAHERQQQLKSSLVLAKVLVFEVDDRGFDIVPEWLSIKNEAVPDLPRDYLDVRGAPLVSYLAAPGADRDSFQCFLHVLIERERDRGFISSLLKRPG